MKVYCDNMPENVGYLTSGKRYDVFDFDEASGTGKINTDNDQEAVILFDSCAHLDYEPWKIEK